MKNKTQNDEIKILEEKFTARELAEGLVFPQSEPKTDKKKEEEESFWTERKKQFEQRSPSQKIYGKILQLKFQLEDYLSAAEFNQQFTFGHFLHEYINRQGKQDKQFAEEVDIKPVVLSQCLNNHRNPTEKFIIRLELHSNGLIPALLWVKLLQKTKEHDIMTNLAIRKEEGKHVKKKLELV